MGEWKDISTAPKDGQPIVACGDGAIAIVWWMNGRWEDDEPLVATTYTHWIEIPELPK